MLAYYDRITRRDWVQNIVIRERTGMNVDLSGRADKSVLKWFGHMKRMEEVRLTKKVMNSRMSGNRARGRPHYRWTDGIKRALNDRGITVDEARVCARERNEWRAIVNA